MFGFKVKKNNYTETFKFTLILQDSKRLQIHILVIGKTSQALCANKLVYMFVVSAAKTLGLNAQRRKMAVPYFCKPLKFYKTIKFFKGMCRCK